MGSKIVNLEIFLIYFFLLIPWPHTHVIKRLCSKDSSRLVRKIVRSKWTPILDKYQVKLPLECPLHPFRDIFAPRQDAKKRDRPTQWTCRLCGKSFYQEKFLDLHFETRHKNVINEAEDAVCLADYCDIMRCEVFQSEESSSLKLGDQTVVTDIEVWGDSLGQNSALAKANVAYLSLLPIRTSSTGASSRAAKVQNRQYCQDKIGQTATTTTTKCHQQTDSHQNSNENLYNNNHYNGAAKRSKYSPTPQSSSDSLTSSAAPHTSPHSSSSSSSSKSHTHKHSASATTTKHHHHHQTSRDTSSSEDSNGSKSGQSRDNNSDDDEADDDGNNAKSNTNTSADESNKTSSAQSANTQKIRASCKTEELSKLKAKCEYLVRSCIGGLILSMTDQQFKDMEEEMNKAVCWYLTCERYWEDGPLESRAFPWGLILILIFVFSCGVCFCYYIIWILFDYLSQLRRDDNQCHNKSSSVYTQHTQSTLSSSTSAAATAAPPFSTTNYAPPRSLSFSRLPYHRHTSWYDQRRASDQHLILLPTSSTTGATTGRFTTLPTGHATRYIPRTTAIRLSSQSKTLHRRSASAGYANDYDEQQWRRYRRRTDSTASSADESGIPTGHFRPTRLYK
ncbi:uncharacterized protein ACRADG_004326 isoform 2-T2 [Cochliomyia hominivorax]